MNSRFGGRAACLAVAWLLALVITPARAGLVQLNPLPYVFDVFAQRSVFDATDLGGLYIRIAPTQTLYMDSTVVLDTASLRNLTVASGLQDSLSIPVFYVDGFASAGTVGLGWMNDNGLALLTSFQENLVVHDEYKDFERCTADYGYECYYRVPAVTPSDVPLGWFRSATVVAHEIGHNLGLDHHDGGLMNPSIAALPDARDLASYALTDAEVSKMLSSPFVQTNSRGFKYIDIVPFSVLLAADDPTGTVPEPGSILIVVLGLFCVAFVRRRGNCRPDCGTV